MKLQIQCPACLETDLIDQTTKAVCTMCKLEIKVKKSFCDLLNHILKCNEDHNSECHFKAKYFLDYDKKFLILTCMCGYYDDIAEVVHMSTKFI